MYIWILNFKFECYSYSLTQAIPAEQLDDEIGVVSYSLKMSPGIDSTLTTSVPGENLCRLDRKF